MKTDALAPQVPALKLAAKDFRRVNGSVRTGVRAGVGFPACDAGSKDAAK
jgi:hypothetical protein